MNRACPNIRVRLYAGSMTSFPTVYTLPPDKLLKAQALSHARTLAHFGGTAWTLLVLWLLVQSGLGARIAGWAARCTPRKWLQGLLVAPPWLLLLTAIDLPASLYLHHQYRLYGISVESWQLWLSDFAKSVVLTLLFGSIAFGVLYALLRKSPRRWWLWFWILAIPCEVAAVFIVPIVIDPLFDHFSPLAQRDPALVQSLERVVQRGGLAIPPSRMFVMDASRKVAAPNAYVTGFGASKRIVVWDTSLTMESSDEILAMYAHEQGHYVLHHIYLGMLYSFVVMLVFFWIAARLLVWAVACRGQRWRIPSLDDWSSLGLLLLAMSLLGFVADPVANVFSRWEEHAADVYGQEALHGIVANPQALCAGNFQHLGELWLEDPAPNALVEWWTSSHPSIAERVRFAAQYDPWGPGKRPRYFPPAP
ncbi:M48 family metallopeptidase [Silvibacterium dinghuense]|uniref:M48 family metallopeptidase n=1 Tax=Silvibacterium dinghuense TaxID=1560006 RepID=UPI0013E914F4|nr:M48 family metallopeptidase [Silvibacterium dinghuense]GGH02057.1 putative metalloprotease YhfN [Silvibacterium dinghuense]